MYINFGLFNICFLFWKIERPKTSRSRQESIKEDPPLSIKTGNRKDSEDKGGNLPPSVTKDAALSPRGRVARLDRTCLLK